MAQSIIFPEWLNANSVRNYPIRENADRKDLSGGFTIPNDLIVAAQINCPRSYSRGTFFVSRLVVGGSFVSVYIGYQPESGDKIDIAYIKAEKDSFSRFSYYSFVGQGDLSSVLGYITIGDIFSSIKEGVGQFEFSSENTPFEVNTYFASVPALERVEVYSSDGRLLHRSNEILKIKAGENIRLSYVQGADEYGAIKIDAIDGENIVKPLDCVNEQRLLPPCIRQINGVSPDSNGRFWIDESECIGITEQPLEHSITILDKCAESCCGCAELEQLTNALESLKSQEETLKELIRSTQTQQSDLLANIIANL